MIDPVEFGREIGWLIKDAVAPLNRRIDTLEQALSGSALVTKATGSESDSELAVIRAVEAFSPAKKSWLVNRLRNQIE